METNEDLVTVFRLAGGGTEEAEILTVQSMLESNGIETMLMSDSPLPNLSEEIRVPASQAAAARRIIAEALAAGPEGAAQAEAETENR